MKSTKLSHCSPHVLIRHRTPAVRPFPEHIPLLGTIHGELQAFAYPSPVKLQPAPTRSTARRRRAVTCRQTPELSRRALMRYAASIVGVTTLAPEKSDAYTFFWPKGPAASKKAALGTTIFSVVPTTVADVNLLPIGIDEAIDDAALCSAFLLGEHHNSLVDHALQAYIIAELRKRRRVVVGLEMVQQRFQPVLDRYIAGEIGELDLYLETEWETRWVWPYELYLPVFRVCREKRIPLVALSLDSETLAKLRAEGGLTNLSSEELRLHVGNASVFAEISKEPAFKAYITECITPSYAAHYRMGLLRETANFSSFYTSRVLRDEAMATRAVRAMVEYPDTTLVCLLGNDHVKFEFGVKARVERQLRALSVISTTTTTARPPPKLRTAMLNPGPADAFDRRDKSLKLEMAVNGDPIPIADYLWFSSPAAANPRRRVKSTLLPPVERLTSF